MTNKIAIKAFILIAFIFHPAQIESLETEIGTLHERMADASFYRHSAEEIATTQKRLRELETNVAAAYLRWQELEQVVE